jgi:hypothetical protein
VTSDHPLTWGCGLRQVSLLATPHIPCACLPPLTSLKRRQASATPLPHYHHHTQPGMKCQAPRLHTHPPVGKSGAGMCCMSSLVLMPGSCTSALRPATTSRRLCGGILVAMPTAMPAEPLTSRWGTLAGRTTGSLCGRAEGRWAGGLVGVWAGAAERVWDWRVGLASQACGIGQSGVVV